MKINKGGKMGEFKPMTRLSEIVIHRSGGAHNRVFELWLKSVEIYADGTIKSGLPDESLSYLTVDELLDLKDEINKALSELLK